MNAREIEVHIEELILHGFDRRSRWQIADVLENELHGLLAREGLPAAWRSSQEQLDAGSTRALSLTNPHVTGKQIATAIHHGGAK
jgi:hypothetical protein